MAIQYRIAMFLDQLITPSRFKAFPHHFGHELFKFDLGCPAEFAFGFADVPGGDKQQLAYA